MPSHLNCRCVIMIDPPENEEFNALISLARLSVERVHRPCVCIEYMNSAGDKSYVVVNKYVNCLSSFCETEWEAWLSLYLSINGVGVV